MADDKSKPEMTVESFQSEHSEIYDSVFSKGKADGEKAERDAFAALKEACGAGNLEIAVQCFDEGKSTVEALKLCNEKLAKENAELKKAPPAAKAKESESADPAESEFADEQSDSGKKRDADKTTDDLKKQFSESKELQEEFGTVEAYLGYLTAVKSGKVRPV